MIKISFIINGSRGLNPLAERTLAMVRASQDIEATEFYTAEQYQATKLAKEHAVDYDIIVAIGGDGTCNEVVQGICESDNRSVGFGIIPNGTGNDFVRMLPKFDPQIFVKALIDNNGSYVDVGKSVLGESTRCFANIADVGFGAKVVELMNRQRKNNIKGKFSYSMAILRSFFTYKKTVIKIVGEDFEYEGKVLMVAFCNGAVFGHGLTINRDAKLDNGKLNITVIGDISLMTYIRKLKDLKAGRKIVHPEAKYFESESIRIERLDETMAMEGDGELFGRGLKEVSILKSRIRLIN